MMTDIINLGVPNDFQQILIDTFLGLPFHDADVSDIIRCCGVFKGGAIPFIGLFFVVVYYFIARAFYSYLRNDDHYKNTRKHSSDKEGESYITKGERDTKKLFIVIWVLVIMLLAVISLALYSINSGLV